MSTDRSARTGPGARAIRSIRLRVGAARKSATDTSHPLSDRTKLAANAISLAEQRCGPIAPAHCGHENWSTQPLPGELLLPDRDGRCDQQDNSPVVGPTGPSEFLGDDDLQYTWLGPGHFGTLVSGPYPDGRRVIWSNGRQTIAKLDYDTLGTLAVLPTGDQPVTPVSELQAEVRGLDELRGEDAFTTR